MPPPFSLPLRQFDHIAREIKAMSATISAARGIPPSGYLAQLEPTVGHQTPASMAEPAETIRNRADVTEAGE